MTKLSRTAIACISAIMVLPGVASSAARANAFFYFLDSNTLRRLTEAHRSFPMAARSVRQRNGVRDRLQFRSAAGAESQWYRHIRCLFDRHSFLLQ